MLMKENTLFMAFVASGGHGIFIPWAQSHDLLLKIHASDEMLDDFSPNFSHFSSIPSRSHPTCGFSTAQAVR